MHGASVSIRISCSGCDSAEIHLLTWISQSCILGKVIVKFLAISCTDFKRTNFAWHTPNHVHICSLPGTAVVFSSFITALQLDGQSVLRSKEVSLLFPTASKTFAKHKLHLWPVLTLECRHDLQWLNDWSLQHLWPSGSQHDVALMLWQNLMNRIIPHIFSSLCGLYRTFLALNFWER